MRIKETMEKGKVSPPRQKCIWNLKACSSAEGSTPTIGIANA